MINDLVGSRQIANPELCITCPLRNGCGDGAVVAQEISAKFKGDYEIVDDFGLHYVDPNLPKLPERVSEVQIVLENQYPVSVFKILTKNFHHLEPQFKKCDKPTEFTRGIFKNRVVAVGCTAIRNLSVA